MRKGGVLRKKQVETTERQPELLPRFLAREILTFV